MTSNPRETQVTAVSPPSTIPMLRIGLIQMRCEKGAVHENLTTLAHYLDEAAACHIDIIGFPEKNDHMW